MQCNSDSESSDWGPDEFLNFGPSPLFLSFTGDEFMNYEPGVPLLPPSPNWFNDGAIDSRKEDRLLVAAAFKTITIFKIPVGVKAPEMIKNFVHDSNSKVLQVRLFPSISNDKYRNSLLATGELGSVTLYCCNSGKALLQHYLHKPQEPKQTGFLNGACFIERDNGDVFAVSVGARGVLVLWNLDTNLTVQHTISTGAQQQQSNKPGAGPSTLTLVEPVPGGNGHVMVAVDKTIHMVDAMKGYILSTFRGHDMPVYCLRWYRGPGSPFSSTVDNPRAKGLLAEVGRGSIGGSSSSDNWRNKPAADAAPPPDEVVAPAQDQPEGDKGLYFASSDMGRGIFVWDVEDRRYVAKTTVTTGGPAPRKAAPRNNRNMLQHAALAWSGSQLLTNNSAGEILSLSFWSSSNGSSRKGVNGGEPVHDIVQPADGTEDSGLDQANKARNGGHKDYSGLNASTNSTIKTIHREHTRVVYNIHVFGGLVVSVGQDRSIIGYCLNTHKVCFNLPSLGATTHAMSFCPHDSSWLTLGMQDNTIKLVNLHSNPPYRSKTIYNTIKGKVYSLSWHPKNDEMLLFGTADGQVGFVDISSGKVSTFSYYHQKSVYKVEWAPPLRGDRDAKVAQSMFVYSFGDREIVMRNPKATMENPLKLSTVMPSLPKNICEFSFTSDYKFLAVGGQDGTISIIKLDEMVIVVKMIVVRKSIQHLLWKPKVEAASLNDQPNGLDGSSSQEQQYTLAIASSDSMICIMELDKVLEEQCNKLKESRLPKTSEPLQSEENSQENATGPSCNETASVEDTYEPLIISSCTRELSGHASRVVWLSYSPHQPNLLVSASYDHTCQVWDTLTGTHIGNYRGHPSRVFRVEFNPNEAGLVYSFGEENTIHQWTVASLKHKSPPSRINKPPESRPKLVAGDLAKDDETGARNEIQSAAAPTSTKTRHVPANDASKKSFELSKRLATHRSLFPLLHEATSHKRSFNLLAVLCMNEHNKIVTAVKEKEDEKSLDDLLDGVDDDDENSSAPPLPASAVGHYSDLLAGVGQALLEPELETPPPAEDMQTLLDFYGSPTQLTSFLHKQTSDHDGRDRLVCSGPLHAWAGTIEQHIRAAMASSSLTPDMVAQAPQVSYELWEAASAAYARQLAAADEPLQAVSYFLNAKQVCEAVDVLLKFKLYREALVLAKARLPYNTELHLRVASTFASAVTFEGHFDLAAILHSSMGNFSSAASCLCRRGDSSSLAVAGLLYRASGHALAVPTLLQAIKVAGNKGTIHVLPPLIQAAPELQWCSIIVATHRALSAYIPALQPDAVVLQSSTTVNGSASAAAATTTNSSSQCTTFKLSEGESLLDAVLRCWVSEGFSASQHQQVYDSIIEHFSTEQKPITLKQFWFLFSIELCKMLLAPSVPAAEGAAAGHLLTALQLSLDWGKKDVVHQVTHLLLPQGPEVPPSLLSAVLTPKEGQAPSSPVRLLSHLYLLSECSALVDNITMTSEQCPSNVGTAVTHKDGESNGTLNPVGNCATDPVPAATKVQSLAAPSDYEREIALKAVDAITRLLDTLSPDFSVISKNSDCKIEMFLNPRSFLKQIVGRIRGEGFVDESTVASIVAILETEAQ